MATTNANKELVQIDDDLWDKLASIQQIGTAKVYTPKQRIMAVQAYYDTGSSYKAGEITGVKPTTIRAWKKTDWWKAVQAEVLKYKNTRLVSILTETVLMAAIKLNSRVELGEPIVDKDGVHRKNDEGQLLYKPLTAHQLSSDGVGKSFDTLMRLHMANSAVVKDVPVHQMLSTFKDTFLQMAKDERKEREPKLIEAETRQ